MFGKVRYCVSHCSVYQHSVRMCHLLQGESSGLNCNKMEMKRSQLGLLYFGHLSNLVLLAALCLGLYTRWAHSQDVAVLLIAFMGLLIFAVTGALVYYFSMRAIGISVSRLWVGCLLGVISFPEADVYPNEFLQNIHDVMNILLVSSLIIKAIWTLAQRILHLVPYKPQLFNYMDALEMIGLAISSLVVGKDFLSISLLTLGLCLTVTAIRTRSFLGLLNLLVLITITSIIFFPRLLHVPANPFGLCLFVGRMSLEPIADLYFSSLTTLERWDSLLRRSKLTQRFLILFILSFEMAFFVLNAKQMPNHKEWFVVVPMFAAFGLLWFCYHLVFLVTCWQLSSKISECNATFTGLEEGSQNMRRVMASKGVRHFSLISQRLVVVTLITTIILAGIGWQTMTAVSVGLWMIVLPTEICMLSLLWEMGSTLGGTCVGYGVVAPAFYRKAHQTATVLPAGTVEMLGSRATNILNTVQRLFTYHFVDTFGCDFSSSGLTLDAISTKLKAFFERMTSDGPRYDTYLMYYSGPVYDNGDWALAANDRLSFDTLLEWWHDTDNYSGARLILILDTEHSSKWLKNVSRLQNDMIGIQASYITGSNNPEAATVSHIGDFTSDWTDYNTMDMGSVNFHEKERRLRAAYAVSRAWTDFTFHLPTDQDINQHWSANFPRFTKPLIKVTNFPKVGNLFCCCDGLVRCLKRKRMSWLPPTECDTGHGFKLIRS